MDLLEKNHVDFDAHYRTYLAEKSFLHYYVYEESSECMPEIDSIQLAKCISRLKDRERRILFARVFGGLDFTEGRSVMAAKKFGYVRVSTREQNPERQIHILREGNLLVVTEQKRFGRNYKEIYKE